MTLPDNFVEKRKASDIGTLMMIDALIESGYYVLGSNINLDQKLHCDIAAFKVDEENIERWKQGNPRMTGIDVKYVSKGPARTQKMFFEIDNKSDPQYYLTEKGWGRYYQHYYFWADEKLVMSRRDSWLDGNEAVLKIAFMQCNTAIDNRVKHVENLEERIEIYKQMRENIRKESIFMAPLYYMQWYDELNRDATAANNYYSKLERKYNGLLMPLDDFERCLSYEKMIWNPSTAKWDLEKHGKMPIPENKPGSKKLEYSKSLQDLYQWQLEQMRSGNLSYLYLLDLKYFYRDVQENIERLTRELNEKFEPLKQTETTECD